MRSFASAAVCLTGRSRRQNGIKNRSPASPSPSQLSFRLPSSHARLVGRSYPPTPRPSIESYWRAHPIRADRLARALAAQAGLLSPRDDLTVPHEFPGHPLGCIKGEPDGGVRPFCHITLGIPAPHFRLDPPCAGYVYGDPVPQLSREDRSYRI